MLQVYNFIYSLLAYYDMYIEKFSRINKLHLDPTVPILKAV